MATPEQWRMLAELAKGNIAEYSRLAMEALRRQDEDAVLGRHISDLSAQWKANASIVAYSVDAGPPRPRKGTR
jgi:hypothetical protein